MESARLFDGQYASAASLLASKYLMLLGDMLHLFAFAAQRRNRRSHGHDKHDADDGGEQCQNREHGFLSFFAAPCDQILNIGSPRRNEPMRMDQRQETDQPSDRKARQ